MDGRIDSRELVISPVFSGCARDAHVWRGRGRLLSGASARLSASRLGDAGLGGQG